MNRKDPVVTIGTVCWPIWSTVCFPAYLQSANTGVSSIPPIFFMSLCTYVVPGGRHGGHMPTLKKFLLSSPRGYVPPKNFYRIQNDLESLFEKNKLIGKFHKNSSKFFKNFS